MAFLKRVFSSDYRRALSSEAAGDYVEAARAYALAGEREKVGEMHLLAAERAVGRQERIMGLRTAARWCGGVATGSEAGQSVLELRRKVARALLDAVRTGGIISDGDRAVVREAAQLFRLGGDGEGEGEALELCGDGQGAAEAYQSAGEVDRLEQLLTRGDERREHQRLLREASDRHQALLANGSRAAALEQLRECARLEPSGPSRELAEALEARRITSGVVALRTEAGRSPVLFAGPGAFPLAIGRDPTCGIALRDARVSRRHAEIVEAGGRLALRDAGSRHGTQLAGVTVEGELPLEGQGEIGLGDAVALAYQSDAAGLRLEVTQGTDRGLVVWLCRQPRPLVSTLRRAGPGPGDGDGAGAGPGDDDDSRLGSVRLRFVAGVPIVDHPAAGAGPLPSLSLHLNDVTPRAPVELLRGDRLEVRDPGATPPLLLRLDVE